MLAVLRPRQGGLRWDKIFWLHLLQPPRIFAYMAGQNFSLCRKNCLRLWVLFHFVMIFFQNGGPITRKELRSCFSTWKPYRRAFRHTQLWSSWYSRKSTYLLTFCWHVFLLFPSVLWKCWLGNRNGIWPVKTGCWSVDGDSLTGALPVLQLQLHHHLHYH